MMTTSSVSKGCFVFKPSPKKKKLSLTAADYFIESLKSSEDCRIRFESYQLLWQQMKSQTEQLQEELNKKLFDNLICYLKKSHSEFQDQKNDWSCRVRSSEIPTAALLLGVNVTDHELTFSSLSDTLHQHVTPYVVLLPAKECPGIKQLLQKLFSQLMGCEADLDLDEEDDHASIPQRSMKCSMASLSGWYQNIAKKSSSPSKRKRPASSGHTQAPPIVVVFKDLESFTSSVLQEFIVISSRYCKELPLVLIFGIATSPMIIHRLLSHSVSSLLCIELFQSLSCTEHLATVVDKLLLSNQFTFKLSGRVLQVLITIFLYHDFSVQNFIKGLQLSAVEHFNSQPLSVLCCDLPDLKHRVKSLSHNQCENIRHLASFRSFVENQTPQAQVKLLTDDGYLKEMTRKLMEDLHTYHENYIPVLRCLHHFTCILPKFPLGKQIRELYCTCLEKNIWDTEEYNSALALLRMLAKDELVATLYKCFEVLKPYSGRQLDSALKKTKEFLAHFKCLEVDGSENVDNEESATQKDLQKKTNLYQLQKTLLEMKETRRTKKPSKFEFLRLEVVDFLDGLVRAYLTRPEEQPLYEVVYFSAASVLRRHLNAVPRVALHTALNNPSTYLKSLANGRTLSSAAPDICIAYKLHLECGRLINLYDWLEAFATVVHADDSDSESLKQVDEMTHARFIRAVSELELLGFVKPTKLKTDHVARLTWGGC